MSSVPVTKCHGGSDKMSPVLDKLLDKTLDNNIIDKSKETGLNDGINEDDFLSLDELNDFLSMNESDLDSEVTKEASKTSDLDDLEVSPKKTPKQDKEISDVNIDSDHKNTQCPATDDEMDPFDDYLDEESEREKAIKRVEKKKRFELARQKNKVSGLDPFDDSDDDDFSFTPRKKQTQDDKKQKIKPKMYFACGGMR
jgi:hypothetical protein